MAHEFPIIQRYPEMDALAKTGTREEMIDVLMEVSNRFDQDGHGLYATVTGPTPHFFSLNQRLGNLN